MKNGKLTETKINTHLQEISEEERILEMRKREIDEQLQAKKEVKEKLLKKKQKIQSKEPAVSDHCLLRFFERIEGYDLEEVRKRILTPKILQQIDTLGSKGVYATEDFYVVVKNKVALTVYRGE